MKDLSIHSASSPEFHFVANNNLGRLHHWLALEIKTGFLFVGFFFAPVLVTTIVIFGAILFTPYMLWKLALLNKWSWIVAFAIIVLGPAIGARFVGSPGALFVAKFVPIMLFFGYTWVLKLATADWMEKQKGEAMLRYYDSKASSSQTSTAL